MKHRMGPFAGVLGCVALLIVACGGSSFEGVEGSAGNPSGGDDTVGAGGKASGGGASAGTSSGGASSAGTTSRAGTTSGGVSSAGMTSGGVSSAGTTSAGTTSGGTASGGSTANPLACESDADCAACQYATAPKTMADCYCPSCGETPLSKSACAANQTAWQKQCSEATIVCPAIACVEPPIPQCKSHLCVVTR